MKEALENLKKSAINVYDTYCNSHEQSTYRSFIFEMLLSHIDKLIKSYKK